MSWIQDQLTEHYTAVTIADCEELAGTTGIEASDLTQASKIIETQYGLRGLDISKVPEHLLEILKSAIEFQCVFVFYNPSVLAKEAARHMMNDNVRVSSFGESQIVAPGASNAMKNFVSRIAASTCFRSSHNQGYSSGKYSENWKSLGSL